jgi:hypothetical protein
MNIDPAQIEDLKEAPNRLFQTVGDFNLPGGFVFSPTYLQAGLIVFCLFLLILTFGMLQHRYTHWTIKGVMPGVALGFTLAFLIEAVLLVGGRTIFTELIGWKDAPKPISNALDVSRERLADVLGVNDMVEETNAGSIPSVAQIIQNYESLEEGEQGSVQDLVCPR